MKPAQWIYEVVDGFYQKAKNDVLIGYHFRNIQDFETHIPRIASFWDIQLLGSTERTIDHPYAMMYVHMKLGIKSGEVGRWLVLFRATLDRMTELHPEYQDLSLLWHERLKFFEGVFLKVFSQRDASE